MNGELCKVVGSCCTDDGENRYPVYVYRVKEVILIKRENLQKVKIRYKNKEKQRKSILPVISQDQENIVETILSHTKRRKTNQAKLFANYLFKSNPENIFDPKFNNDVKYMLSGNCIFIPSFFNKNKNNLDRTLFNYLMKDFTHCDMTKRFRRLMVGYDDTVSLTYQMIVQSMTDYFDVDMHHSIINLYRNGNEYASFHTDKYDRDEADITIGASFGQKRDLAFLHKKTLQTFPIQQNNCDIFAFTSVINEKFRHSILKTNNKIGPRFSIIVWGKRRTLNAKNSSIFERMDRDEMLKNNPDYNINYIYSSKTKSSKF